MLKEILPFKAETLGAEIIEMETDLDHVHLLISCDPQYGIHKVVKGLKGFSARVVGSVSLDVMKQYIENQQLRTKKK